MDGWGQSKIAKDVGNSKVGGDFTLTPEFLGDFTLTPEFVGFYPDTHIFYTDLKCLAP